MANLIALTVEKKDGTTQSPNRTQLFNVAQMRDVFDSNAKGIVVYHDNEEHRDIVYTVTELTEDIRLASLAEPIASTPGEEFILDADADTSIRATTDDQIDIKIGGSDDFQMTANTFTAIAGSEIKTDTINETTAAAGVTVDGVLNKDGGITTTIPNNYASGTAITAFATGGQASATALTKEFNEITTCATLGDSVKLPAAEAGKLVVIKNNGAAAADVFPATGDSINALAVNLAVKIMPGETISFRAVDATVWEASFGLFGDTVSERTAAAGVTVDGVLLKDGTITGAATTTVNAATFLALIAPDIMAAGNFNMGGTVSANDNDAQQTLTGPGAIGITTFTTYLVTDANPNAMTLAAGTEGLFKFIRMKTDAGDAVVTVTNLEGGTTLTFDAVGDSVLLFYRDAKWNILSNNGVALA
jgi:hypothetical protein